MSTKATARQRAKPDNKYRPSSGGGSDTLLRTLLPFVAPTLLVLTALDWHYHWFSPTETDLIIGKLAPFDPKGAAPPCVQPPPPPAVFRFTWYPNPYPEALASWRATALPTQQTEQRKRFMEAVAQARDSDPEAKTLAAAFHPDDLDTRDFRYEPPGALDITRIAAGAGLPWAMVDMAASMEKGTGYSHRDAFAPQRLYFKAASLGSAEAQRALAAAYQRAGNLGSAKAMLDCAAGNGQAWQK